MAITNYLAKDATARARRRRAHPAGVVRAQDDHQARSTAATSTPTSSSTSTEQPGWEPKDYIDELYGAFRRSSTYHGPGRPQTRCVIVDYADDFHVDVVPYLERAGATLHHEPERQPLRAHDPEGFNEWLDEQNRRRERPPRRGDPPDEVRARLQGHVLHQVGDPDHVARRRRRARHALWGDTDYYRDHADRPAATSSATSTPTCRRTRHAVIADPSGPGENFDDRWDQDELRELPHLPTPLRRDDRRRLRRARQDKSVALWQSVFGERFTKATALKTARRAACSAPPTIPTGHRGRPAHPDRAAVQDRAGRPRGERRGFRHYSLPSRSNLVGKNRELIFSVDTSTIPGVFDIYWKVRNSGEEAVEADQLRGQIFKGGPSHREWARYSRCATTSRSTSSRTASALRSTGSASSSSDRSTENLHADRPMSLAENRKRTAPTATSSTTTLTARPALRSASMCVVCILTERHNYTGEAR